MWRFESVYRARKDARTKLRAEMHLQNSEKLDNYKIEKVHLKGETAGFRTLTKPQAAWRVSSSN